jgi:hypothetical protein
LFILCLRERQLGAWAKTTAAALVAWLVVDVPIYLWSPDAFKWFWEFNSSRGPDYGSLWLVASIYGHTASPHQINLATWLIFGAACLAIAALGLLAPRRPRLPQLLFLVVMAFLVVNKVYSPQYVIWLLPLAALARPRWRDLLIWQACEVFYFFAVWMHIADFFVSPGTQDWVYALAIIIRVAGQLYIAGRVIRDILSPWHDPVRADGLSDDPLGGVLDEGIDAEYAAAERARWGLEDDLGDGDLVEVGGREPDLDVDLLADGRDRTPGRDKDHADLHMGRLDEPALLARDHERGQ